MGGLRVGSLTSHTNKKLSWYGRLRLLSKLIVLKLGHDGAEKEESTSWSINPTYTGLISGTALMLKKKW